MRRLALLPLALIASSAAPAPRAPALNHVYFVLDQQTFDAIRNSRAIADLLGPNDGGLPDYAPSRADTDRIFLRGRQTYLELFAPNNRFDEPVGKIGIALAEDHADRFEALARRWRDWCGPKFSRDTVSWTRSKPAIS